MFALLCSSFRLYTCFDLAQVNCHFSLICHSSAPRLKPCLVGPLGIPCPWTWIQMTHGKWRPTCTLTCTGGCWLMKDLSVAWPCFWATINLGISWARASRAPERASRLTNKKNYLIYLATNLLPSSDWLMSLLKSDMTHSQDWATRLGGQQGYGMASTQEDAWLNSR